ncbi:pilus assembly protein PilS [Neisseria meningitidis]|nr:pilus assembly protein PilS [Neisseria meningitidis]
MRCCRNATEPSFPRKWESRISGFQSFPIDSRLRGNDESIHTETCTTSFPRKWESRTRGLGNCFYPISFCADRSGFPPVRE